MASSTARAAPPDGPQRQVVVQRVGSFPIKDVTVHFGSGGSSLGRGDKAHLSHFVAMFAGGISDLSVRIAADGDAHPGSLLGWRRALAVKDFLVTQGLHSECIELASEPDGGTAAVMTYLGTCP